MNKVKINWKKVINKSILDKCEHIFEALGWDLSLIKEIKIKKERKKKELLKENKSISDTLGF